MLIVGVGVCHYRNGGRPAEASLLEPHAVARGGTCPFGFVLVTRFTPAHSSSAVMQRVLQCRGAPEGAPGARGAAYMPRSDHVHACMRHGTQV